MAINDEGLSAVCDCLQSLTLQLVDMNTSMAEIYSRMIVEGTYLQGMVEELRTLNAAAGRIEDQISYRP
jgi:hypothetical protein